MKNKEFRKALYLLAAFAIWTGLAQYTDVSPIGPQETSVGLSTLNKWIHALTGVHMVLYRITDWLSLIPIGIVSGFAILGLVQWVRRKDIRQVDRSILLLGGFYILVMAVYFFFEMWVVNYRPVLIDGCLEASYPSSTTVLVICVMLTAGIQLRIRVHNKMMVSLVACLIVLFTVLMVIGRLVSGVHWFSDIIGGILLSAGLVKLYQALL